MGIVEVKNIPSAQIKVRYPKRREFQGSGMASVENRDGVIRIDGAGPTMEFDLAELRDALDQIAPEEDTRTRR